MEYDEIRRRIFDRLRAKNGDVKDYWNQSADLASVLQHFNKRELHAVYMALKAIKR